MKILAATLALAAAAAQQDAKTLEVKESLERDYSFSVIAGDGKPEPSGISGKKPMEKPYSETVRSLDRLLRRLPQKLVSKLNIKSVVIMSDLKDGDKPVAGIAEWPRVKGEDCSAATIYLCTDFNSSDFEHAFFHEIFHLVDARYNSDDEDWAAFGSKYSERTVKVGEGLISDYAATAIEEDKAEMFAYMVLEMRSVAAQAKKDETLGKKLALIKRRCSDACSEIDDEFWDWMQKHKSGAWDSRNK